jgi:glycosyltransferase involved in cell wall biosynthesis
MEFSVECMKQQLVKPDLWIIVDNSDILEQSWEPIQSDVPVKYIALKDRQPIGALRNMCLEAALAENAEYILFWDDDDYYDPRRIQQNVDALKKNPTANISACSKMYLLLTRENVMLTSGPFHEKHGTAATFCIRADYARKHRFEASKVKGEEITFTENWSANLVQVEDPDHMIVVMGHSNNTVDKSDLLVRPKLYSAEFINKDNGRMTFRARWNPSPKVWDLFRRTFSV